MANILDISARRKPTAEEQRVRAICASYANRPATLLEILLDVQAEFSHVSDAAKRTVADALNLSRAQVHGVATFYTDLSAHKKGRVVVKVCCAEACQAMGGGRLAAEVTERAQLAFGETAGDGSLSVEAVYCLGNCALAPTVMVGETLIGRATAERVSLIIDEQKRG